MSFAYKFVVVEFGCWRNGCIVIWCVLRFLVIALGPEGGLTIRIGSVGCVRKNWTLFDLKRLKRLKICRHIEMK